MVVGLGGSLRRTPARASEASDAASSRQPLLAIRTPVSQFKRKLEWPVETPAKPPSLSRFQRPPSHGEETTPRVCPTPSSTIAARHVHRAKTAHGGSVQRKLTKSVTKPTCIVQTSGDARGLGLGTGYSVAARGLPAMVVNSEEVPHYELQEDPSFWAENNVQVVIRVRPLNSTEKMLHGYNRCLKQESVQSITWIGPPENRFTFDHVACESVNQEELFRVVGLPIVENCIAGYNSCVFSYGQTGSGKTHTMLGEICDSGVKPGSECGMIPRIFELLIARIRAEEQSRRDEKLKYTCTCSFLEIYNEQATDLLDPSSTNPLREGTNFGAYADNLTKREVTCVSDIITLLMQTSVNRKVSATSMNSASSRSHCVFTCTIESRCEKDSVCKSRFARLNLVDLAGSERQMASGAEGERLKEASNINKSLSTLSHVIMKLTDRPCGKKTHVPYRDSKLTFLLQDSLGGNSKTLIIANVSPSLCSSNETLSTLKFAQRARLIQNNAVVNEDSLEDVQTLQHQICVLKEELAAIKGQCALQTHGALEAEEQCNADVVCHLRKQSESAVQELQMLRSQFFKLLQEKENVIECHLQSQITIKDLSSEVLQLKSEIIDREKYYEARLKELENKMQEKDSHAAASLIPWHEEKEALEFEVSAAKDRAQRKSSEASTLIAKFQEAHATINADSTVKALMEANENARLQEEKYKQKESLFIIEKDDLLSEISSLKMLLDVKKQNYQDMEKKFESSLLEANEVALELEDGIRHLKNLVSENIENFSSDVEWMKSKLRQFAELARTWLEDIWLETVGKDCAVSVLNLCHMGVLLERVTWLHAENSSLQRGICESNILISTLRLQDDKTKNEQEMCSALKSKLLLDINHSFGRIAKKEQEATELSSRLDSFGKKILHLQAQEEAMLALADSMYNELSILTKEIDATNMKSNENISLLEEQLANTISELGAVSVEKSELRSQLNLVERNSYSMKEELAHGSNATERMEERLIELTNLLDERSSFLEILQNDFSKLSDEKKLCDSLVLILRDKLVMAQALAEESEANAMGARQIAVERKTYAEVKDKEVKLLERSIDDLESTVCALEEKLASTAKSKQGTEPNKDEVNLKRMHAAIQMARNYRKPSRDYSWVNSLCSQTRQAK